jgi:hypothetical protein
VLLARYSRLIGKFASAPSGRAATLFLQGFSADDETCRSGSIVRQTVRIVEAGLRGNNLTIACQRGADNAD